MKLFFIILRRVQVFIGKIWGAHYLVFLVSLRLDRRVQNIQHLFFWTLWSSHRETTRYCGMFGLLSKFCHCVIFCLVISGFSFTQAEATTDMGKESTHQPILMNANKLIYESFSQIVTAQGNVEISQYVSNEGWRVLYAENVIYDQKKDKIIAKGKVRLREPSGDIITANEIVFTGDFKEGVSKALHLWTNDQAQLAASKGKRENGNETEFEKAVYSPCKICKAKDNNQYPLWQIKADKVVHNRGEKKIVYQNARLEIKGLPVFYLPYFSHPDPTVKRKSGFLFPMYGVSQDLGALVSLPVYYVIAPNRDMTLTPMLTTKQGPIMVTEYRHRFYNGDAKFAGSYTKSHGLNKKSGPVPLNGPRPPQSDRWHLASKINYDISDERRFLLDFSRASDTTYLSRYPITRQTPAFTQGKNLTSTATVEQFKDENYLGINGYSFQTDAPKTTPIVFPAVAYHHQLQPDKMGGVLSFDSNFLSLSRQTPVPGRFGTQMQRLSTGVTWRLPYVSQSGQLITLMLSGRADGYYARRYQLSSTSPVPQNNSLESSTGRLFPQGSLDWRYPLLKQLKQTDWIIQPMGMVVASPYQLNNKHIPNEDSNSFELDDTTLFLPNRFDGIDRVDSGYRFVYGIENSFYFPNQKFVSVFLGQDRRLDNKQIVPVGLGEDAHKSDYVGRIKVKPISWFMARYRTAITPNNNRPRYSELGFTFGDKRLNLDLGYVFLSKKATVSGQDISQLNWKVGTEIVENWSLSFAQIRNLQKKQGNNRSLANFISATYKDECFQLDVGVYKTSYKDRDIHPDSGFLVQLTFKNLGYFSPSVAPKYPGSMLTSF
jgi:LPS-assembly protein